MKYILQKRETDILWFDLRAFKSKKMAEDYAINRQYEHLEDDLRIVRLESEPEISVTTYHYT